MSPSTNDANRRAGRTATQAAGPGAIIALLAAFNVIHWNPAQTAAVMIVATPVGAWLQNWFENKTGKDLLISKKNAPSFHGSGGGS